MKDKSGIYKWTSPSGKMYIGQSVDLQKRKNKFLNFGHRYAGQKIECARKSYPHAEDWQYEILEYCPTEKLDEREVYWINHYDSMNKGYNYESGGNLNKHVSETLIIEHRIKMKKYYSDPQYLHEMSDRMKKYCSDPQHLQDMSDRMKKYYIEHPEAKAKVSNQMKEYYKEHPEVKIEQGKKMKEYYTEENRKKHSELVIKRYQEHPEVKEKISNTLKGKFVGEKSSMFGKKGKEHPASVAIVQFDMDGNPIKTWNSTADAERDLKISGASISSVCHNRRKSAGGYKWMFEKDYQNELKLYMYHILLNEMKEEAA